MRTREGAPQGSILLRRIARHYQTLAVMVLTSLLLFAAANVLVSRSVRWGLFPRAELGGFARQVGVERLLAAYPGWTRRDLEAFLAERVRNNRWEYEAFTEFRQKGVSGRFINVSENGFRMGAGAQPWPPEARRLVYVLGGSTAYGDGVADGATIPARLQHHLQSRSEEADSQVYNFARPGYYSTQERILFEQLLQSASPPGVAVFLDGLNDSFYDPNPTKEYPWSAGRTSDIRKLLEERESHRSRYLFSRAIRELPIIALLLGGHREDAATLQEMDDAATRSFADKVIGRWRENKRVIESIAKARGIRTLFVWQPMPAYGYDGRFHILGTTPPGLRRQAASYEALDRIRAQPDVAQNLLWLADMQRAHKKNLYVDDVHYTEAFSDEVADRIAKALASESGQR